MTNFICALINAATLGFAIPGMLHGDPVCDATGAEAILREALK